MAVVQRDPDAPAVAPMPPSMVRRFFADGAIYGLAGVLSQGIAFLLFPFFAHVFDPRDYGLIDLLGVLTILVNLTIALEISQGLGRHFAESSPGDRRAYASTAFIFTATIYSAALVGAQLFAPGLTSTLFGADVDPDIVRVAVCGMWVSGLLYLGQDLLRWELRPRAFAIVSVATAAMTTLTAGILILGFGVGVTGAFIAQLVGSACGAALAYTFGRHLFRPIFDTAKLRVMLAYSLPLVPASVGVFFNGYADRLAIQSSLTLADVGVYGIAYRLSLVAGLVLLGFQGALLPLVLARHAEPSTPPELERIFRLFCALALGVVLLVSVFADEILRVLTPPSYHAAAEIVPLVIAATMFGGMYIFAPGLNIAKRTVLFMLITVCAGLANLALAFALVGPLGIEGAALAYLATAFGGFAAMMIVSQRLYPVPHRWARLVTAAVGICALVAVARSVGDALGPPIVVNVVFAAAGLAGLASWLVERDERAQLLAFRQRLSA